MSHRKYNAPRRGSLGYLPRGRSHAVRGKIRSFPKDDVRQKPHLTAFVGFKAGMTHVLREVTRANSRLNKKEAVEPVTILETPPMLAIGVIGYKETVSGLKPVTTAWASFVSEEVKRNFYKNWYTSTKKAFSKLEKKEDAEKIRNERIELIKKEAKIIRVIAHTQMAKLPLGQKKAHLIEIQVNGGDIAHKVDFAVGLLEKNIPVDKVFKQGELVDTIGVGKGFGWEGVIHRYGTKRLQKKTHRGRRKVACIGPWNPMRVLWTVARYGQRGCHHRTELNKRIYKLAVAPKEGEQDQNGSTEFDLTKKSINPMGGFPHYGLVKNDFLMIKGSVVGTAKKAITIRKALRPNSKRIATEEIGLKWIDTSSKFGHGRFQTVEERNKYMGKLKISKKEATA
jgi:large subunit ribosomal protein L3e